MKNFTLILCSLCSFLILTPFTWAQEDAWTGQELKNNDIITVGTIHRPPFSLGESTEKVQGFSIDLWERVASKNHLTYQYRIFTGFSDMIDAVASGDIDLAVANISITFERLQYMDFSVPIYDGGLRILIEKKKEANTTLEKRKNIILESDLLRILSVVLLTILILLIATFFYPQYKDKNYWRIFFVLVGLIIFGFILIQARYIRYQQEQIYHIGSYKDLFGKKIGVGKNTTMSKFLDQKGIPYQAYHDFQQSLIALESGQVDAIVADAPVAEYYVSHDGKDRAQLAGKIFAPDKIAFAIKQDSPLLETINTALLEMKENGEYQKIKEKWFGR